MFATMSRLHMVWHQLAHCGTPARSLTSLTMRHRRRRERRMNSKEKLTVRIASIFEGSAEGSWAIAALVLALVVVLLAMGWHSQP